MIWVGRLVKEKLIASPLLSKVFLLLSTTVIGQIVVIGCSPILTRLYSPQDFGVFAVYMSSLSVLLSVISLRYEAAIPIPADEDCAVNLLVIAVMNVILAGILTALASFCFLDYFGQRIGVLILKPYLWLVFCGVIGAGLFRVFNFWALRAQAFQEIAKTKITQNIGQVLAQILFGLIFTGPSGLLVGDVIGRAAGIGTLFTVFVRKIKLGIRARISVKSLLATAQKYKKFPLLSTFAVFLNTMVLQCPIIVLNYYYGAEVTGWFNLTWIVLGAPVSLIGQAVGQVYTSEFALTIQTAPEKAYFLFAKMARKLLWLSIPLSVFFYFIAPSGFIYVFGSNWEQAGHYMQYLSIMFLFLFVSSPLGVTLDITERQDLMVVREIIRALLHFGSLIWAGTMGYEANAAISLFGLACSVGYIFHILFSWYAIKTYRMVGSG